MADLSKYDILINDLVSMETQASVLKNKIKVISESNKNLELQVTDLKRENMELKHKLSELEAELKKLNSDHEGNIFSSLNIKERENLKTKIQNLITRIDYHLSS